MPAPPRQSIGGTKGHQIEAFEFSKSSYNYLVDLEAFTKTEEFNELNQVERDLIANELKNQTKSYNILWERVNSY